MRPRALLVTVALFLFVAAAVAVPVADARAPPTPVCGVCDLDRTVSGGDAVVAGESSLTVTLHENGTTTWRARAELAEGADALSANESLRRAVATEAARDGIAEPRDVDARVDGETLVVGYRDPGAAERSLGVVVFTPLTPASPNAPMVSGGEGWRYLAADRLTVRAGSGLDVRGAASEVESDDRLVWTRNASGGGDADRPSLDVDVDPVAVEENDLFPGARAWIARRVVGNHL